MQEKDFVIVYLEKSNRITLFTHVSFREIFNLKMQLVYQRLFMLEKIN